ncbi:DNAH [Acanthosepion pharaonis]|uniref:DNAH n=1 Tax=Acanthosepion pharaonis TaxID=158019 RepID=A0A812CN90_ACAPH|nr:DNAH [Sepia pharaonis]
MNDKTVSDINVTMKNENDKLTENEKIKIVAVKSSDGEKISLNKKVFLEDNVEEWLRELKSAVSEEISELSLRAIHEVEVNMPFEELTQKYPTQVCHLSTLYYWSMEIESGIQKLKHDRKALSIQTNYLRDLLDSICQRKIKECSDFEWRRTIKCYLLPDADDIPKPHLVILNNNLPYGGEFSGSCPNIIVTPATDKCFLFIAQAIYDIQAVCLVGPTEVGKKETLMLPNVNPSVAFFMTVTVQLSSDWHFPQKVKSVFRTVSLIKPDAFWILKGNFFSSGFKGANFLAGRLLEIASLARNHLPSMYSSRFHLSSLISTVKRAFQIQLSRDEKSWEKLENILRPESQVSTSTSKASLGSTSRQSQISSGARNSLSAAHVKKTDLKILIQAIEESLSLGMDADTFSRFQTLKLVKINPLTVDDFELMFGGLDSNEQLVDGLFTSVFKKANRNTSKTWITLDASVNPGWMDYLVSAMIHLKNGDIIYMNENVKLFLETDNIQSASPTILSKLGLIYVDGIVGWELLAKTWIKTRKNRKIIANGNPNLNDMEEILMQCFQTTIEGVVKFLKTKVKHSTYVTEVGMFTNCLQMLTLLLSDKLELAGNVHVKKLFLFCLIWAFGGHLNEEDRKSFSSFLLESRTNV